jgi:hypothetical protein
MARMVARQRDSTLVAEQALDNLLTGADQAMVNAFTSGFRVSQTKLAIEKCLPDPNAAAAALESAQIIALAILVREQMDPAQFRAVYRPFATVLPAPGYEPAAPIDRQIADFLRLLPTLKGDTEAEVATVAKALSEKPKVAGPAATGAFPGAVAIGLDPAANYSAAWKLVISTAVEIGRTTSFRMMQETAEQVAPHDGLGIVGFAGVAAGGIFMRDALPIEKVLLLYEPFAAAFPYESLGKS